MMRNMETNNRARRGNRKPLSDCTNNSSSVSSSSSAIVKTKIPSLSSPIPKLPNSEANSSSRTKTKAVDRSSIPNSNITSNPSSLLVPSCSSTPSRSITSSSPADTASREIFEPCSVYTRGKLAGKRKSRRKTIAAPATCIPAVDSQFTGDQFNAVSGPSKSSTEPPKKKQCHTQAANNNTNHDLPQDFIEQQKAYFAEVDAFPLLEEEVASVDDLD